MRNKQIETFETQKELLNISKIKTNDSFHKKYFLSIGTILSLLIIALIYFKQSYQSIYSSFSSLSQEFNKISIENNGFKRDVLTTQNIKDQTTKEYESLVTDVEAFKGIVSQFSTDLEKNKMSLQDQKNKTQPFLDELYKEYNKLCAESSLPISELNKAYFPFSHFPIQAQDKEYHSNIIRSIDDIQFIEQATGYKIEKPCYQSPRFTLMGQLFRNYCKDSKPTVSLYLTERNKRFGGYTALDWGTDSDKYDSNSFVFNLDSRKVWKAKPGHESVMRFIGSFPSFGEGDIKCAAGEVCSVNKYLQSFERNDEDFEINGGYETFRVLGVEVFQLVKPERKN